MVIDVINFNSEQNFPIRCKFAVTHVLLPSTILNPFHIYYIIKCGTQRFAYWHRKAHGQLYQGILSIILSYMY